MPALDFLRRNAWNLIGTFLGIGGIVTGYIFYRAALPVPALSFLDPYPHSQIIDYGAMSKSPIRLIKKDGAMVTQNVYSARLYVWNSGNISLRRAAILKDLKLEAKGIEILDLAPTKVIREDITKFSAVLGSANAVNISFDILEPADGGVVDVLYAAKKPTTFQMVGVVEGVKSFSPRAADSASDVALKTVVHLVKSGMALLFVGAALMGGGKILNKMKEVKPASGLLGRAIQIFASSAMVVFLLGALAAAGYQEVIKAKKEAVDDPRVVLPAELLK